MILADFFSVELSSLSWPQSSQSGIFLPNQLKASENLFSIYLRGHKPNKLKGACFFLQ